MNQSNLAPQRLNQFLAYHLGISRRSADDLIAGGQVTIDGQTAILGSRVNASDEVIVDGAPLVRKTTYTTLLFHKPVGYVCSRRAQGDSPTIYDLVPIEYKSLKSVGRLDRDSSGLILLTDDGQLAHRLTHPSFHKIKIYEVTLDHALQPLHRQMISDYGVMLEDGKSQFELERLLPADAKPARYPLDETSAAPSAADGCSTDDGREALRREVIEGALRSPAGARSAPAADLSCLASAGNAESPAGEHQAENDLHWRITMSEGRNRQIRRTFAALGYEVTGLHRTDFGTYSISGIKKGGFAVVDTD